VHYDEWVAFSGAHYYLLNNLVVQFRRRYPSVKVRAFGHNSTEVAGAVRDGEFESGLVVYQSTTADWSSVRPYGSVRQATSAPTQRF